jgi:RimJ/RimL family protein N-acetyltransferase
MKQIELDKENALSQNKLNLYRIEADEIDLSLADQIIKKSRQPHVMKFEKEEDAEGRFENRESYKAWASKERVLYLLLNSADNDLAGIIWFGKRKNPNIDDKYSVTFGIRLYEGYLGKGLSKPLMQASHSDVGNILSDKYIWLDYDKDNIIAGKAYRSFGYEELGQADGRVIMGKKL